MEPPANPEWFTWVTTGIRRTDGLCPPPPGVDLFSSANTCIADGHELVQTYEYEGGLFDGIDREFRGFEMVLTTDADGSTTEVTYSQDDVTRGMKLLEETVSGPYTVARDTYVWGTQADGSRTQVFLREQKREVLSVPNDPLLNQCSYDRHEPPDEYGRIAKSCSLDCNGAPATPGTCANPTTGQITTTTTWANPQSGWAVRERPSSVRTEYKSASGPIVKLVEKFFRYDGVALGTPLALGSVTRGALTWIETWLDQSALGTPTNPVVLQQVDSFGNVVLVRDPRGNDTTNNFAAAPYSLYAATTTNALGHQTEQVISLAYGKPLSETGANDEITSYAYDGMGRLTCEALPGDSCSGGSGATRTYSYVYPTGGAFEGNLSYAEMRLKEPEHPSGYRTSRVYLDALGRERLATVERIIGTGTTLSTVVVGQEQYDAIGRIARSYFPYVKSGSIPESPAAAFIAYDYNLNGLGVSDPLGRPHIITPPDGNATTSLYNGRRTKIFDPLNNETRIEADAFGRDITKDLYDQGTLKMRQDYGYDGLGRIRRQTIYTTPASRGGPSTVATEYDSLGRVIQRVDPDSGTWTFGYDPSGNLVFEDDPKTGQHVHACYDAVDRVTKRYVFLASDQYLPSGCSQPSPESTYSYDSTAGGNKGIGRLTGVADPSGAQSWFYDARGNVTSNAKTVLGKTAVMEATYDPVDRLQTLTYFGTEQVTYEYRADGQVRRLSSTGTTYVSDAGYDIFGRLDLLRHGNGTDDTVTFYGAAENFRPQRITTTKSGVTTPYLDLQYHYNSRGLIEQIDDLRNPTTDLSNSAILDYDGLGRLTSFDWLAGVSYDESFTYDSLGNLTSLGGMSLSHSLKPHQALSRSDGTQMLYDSNGSRVQKQTPAETYEYNYDGLGRLTTVTRAPTPSDPPSKTVQYTYDAAGDLVARVVTTGGVAGPARRFFSGFVESYNGTATKYYQFADRLVASQDVTTNALSEAPPGSPGESFRLPPLPLGVAGLLGAAMLLLLWSPGRSPVHIGVRISPSRATAVVVTLLFASIPVLMGPQCGGGGGGPPPVRHFHFDHLGSLQSVSDGAGSLWRQSRYRPYGVVRGRYDGAGTSAPANEKARHEFIGYETEIDANLDFAYARFYDPDMGQFLTHDPMAEFPSPYAYTHGDPINFSDPSGECEVICWGLIILTVLFVAKTSYNYARSGDWEFSLESGVFDVVPEPGVPIQGPIQAATSAYNGYRSSAAADGTETGGFRVDVGAVTTLRMAVESAQGERREAGWGVLGRGAKAAYDCLRSPSCREALKGAAQRGAQYAKEYGKRGIQWIRQKVARKGAAEGLTQAERQVLKETFGRGPEGAKRVLPRPPLKS
jgi:RHS repeat-associated protein